jgi:dolichol-phosphate mannosyltransferase
LDLARLGVLIPTHNEARNIERLVEGLLRLNLDMDILFIDGLSTDSTREIIHRLGETDPRIHLIETERKGIGAALVGGMGSDKLRELRPDLVITMDGDLSHDPAQLTDLVEACSKDTVVVGSRYVKVDSIEGRSILRNFISILVNTYTRKALNLDIKDSTSGYRCYPSSVLKEVVPDLRSEGYVIQIEILMRVIKKGYRVLEVPIVFRDREFGESKLSILETLRFIKEIAKFA